MDEERPAVRDVEHGAVGIGASADASPAQTSFHILVDGLAFLSKVGGKRDSMSGGFGHFDSLPENRRRCTLCPGDRSLLAALPERVGACLGRAVQFMHEPAAHIMHSGHRQPNCTQWGGVRYPLVSLQHAERGRHGLPNHVT